MPSVQFKLEDLNNLVKKKLTPEQVEDLCQYAKTEFEQYDKETDTVHVSCADTAMPYVWSVEGIARLLRGVLGMESGLAEISISSSSDKVLVDDSTKKSRPFISLFSVSGTKVTDDLLRQLIQLQEKLADTYGRRRKKVSIGIYSKKQVVFPLQYTMKKPAEISFCPLGFQKKMTADKILKDHPTGQKYADALKGEKLYPVLLDAEQKVLSLIPIINSDDLGRVKIGETDLIVEVTGTDEEAVDITANILAFAFSDRGFKISGATMIHGGQQKQTPHLMKETISITKDQVAELLGISLTDKEIESLLKKARYGVESKKIVIPPYRSDILHPVDVIEDVAVMYGYDNIESKPLTNYTVGDVSPEVVMIDRMRKILAGFGMQEVMSPMLTNKDLLYKKMNCKDLPTVEIKEYMSSSYSVVRTWLIPTLMDVLSKNKHNVYPQKIFEQGLVTIRKAGAVQDFERIAVVLCGADEDYTKIRQVADAVLNALGVQYDVVETEHESFIEGRVARITVNSKGIAYLGEIHPKVLENFDVQLPVAALEINISDLFELTRKKSKK